jgi:hypothetical protein
MSRKGLGSLLNGVEDEIKQPTTEAATPATPLVRDIVALDGHPTYNQAVTEITNLIGTLEVNRTLLQEAKEEVSKVKLKLDEAKNVLKDYKDTIEEVKCNIDTATTTASSFVINATLDTTSITQLETAHTKMLEDVANKWDTFATNQAQWVKDTKTELKAIFEGKGVWLSDRTFWTCLCIFSLLLIFFAMTIFANITIIHSGDLTLLLWIYGIAIAAAVGLSYRDSRKR